MSKSPIKILVVDDSDVILNSLKHLFEEYAIDVFTCTDGLEGIQKAAELQPNLIFLDLMMPNLDGLKMLQVKHVLKDIKDIPVIVISANTARRNVLAAIEAGADKVISKPLKKEILLKAVSEVLGEDVFVALPKNPLSSNDQKLISNKLVDFFLQAFPEKKQSIQQALRKKDIELLRSTVHEIRGAGGTIGQPKITTISGEIEDKEIESATDWVFIEFKCNELFQEVYKLKEVKT